MGHLCFVPSVGFPASCVKLCVSTELLMCLVLESYCSYRELDYFTVHLPALTMATFFQEEYD